MTSEGWSKLKVDPSLEGIYNKTQALLFEDTSGETKKLKKKLDQVKRDTSKEYLKIGKALVKVPKVESVEFKNLKDRIRFKKEVVSQLMSNIADQDTLLMAMTKQKIFAGGLKEF